MNKILKISISVLLVFVFAAAAVVLLRNMDFFDVTEVKITVEGPINSDNSAVTRIANKVKGQNILSVNLNELKKSFIALDGVDSASVKRYWPSTILVDLKFFSYRLRCYTEENSEISYYLADENSIVSVSNETFCVYDGLCSVLLDSSYCKMLEKWGPDEGFIQMSNLVCALDNNLITYIKYDNNNVNGFGRLDIKLSNHDVTLSVREPVTVALLQQALERIEEEITPFDRQVQYDLYRLALVRRTGE